MSKIENIFNKSFVIIKANLKQKGNTIFDKAKQKINSNINPTLDTMSQTRINS